MMNGESEMMDMTSANEQENPEGFDLLTTRCADLSIQTDSAQQQRVPHNQSGQKKRRADGSLKNERTGSMKELKDVLQSQCVGQTSSETRLRMDVDNLMRRVAVLEDLKSVRRVREMFPARYLPRKDQDCGSSRGGTSLGMGQETVMVEWKKVQEDTLR